MEQILFWININKKKIITWLFIGVIFVFYSSFLLYVFVDILMLKLHYASIVVGEICIVSRFLINHFFIFDNDKIFQALIKFHIASIGGLIIWWLILNTLNFFGIHYLVASIVAVMFSTFVNFTTSFFWVWHEK